MHSINFSHFLFVISKSSYIFILQVYKRRKPLPFLVHSMVLMFPSSTVVLVLMELPDFIGTDALGMFLNLAFH